MRFRDQVTFYPDDNHPYGHLDQDMKRRDRDLALVYNRWHRAWQVIRRYRTIETLNVQSGLSLRVVDHDWCPVRLCQFDDGSPRHPGEWLLRSLFCGLQITSAEDARKWVRGNRRREAHRHQRKAEEASRTIEEIAREAYPAINREVVTVP